MYLHSEFLKLNYFTAPSERPPEILLWIKQKKMIEGTTTTAHAAIKAPQLRISAPSSVLIATEMVVLSELLIKIKAYKNSFHALINI